MIKKIVKKSKITLISRFFIKLFNYLKNKICDFLNRRPHRSFRITKRRDYITDFKLPDVITFTKHVMKTLWVYRKKFIAVVLIYSIATFLLVGIASQESLNLFRETIDSTSSNFFDGSWGSVEKTSLLFITAISGGLNEGLTEVQQLYASLILIMTWLSCVWLLRNLLAGHKVKARDAVYSSGSPIIPTVFVSFLLVLQILPIAVALIGYGVASNTGLLAGGIEAMMFWVAAVLLGVLSMYWVTSTLFSLVVVTLPGMYPYQAIKIGGDLVVGRRIKILIRFLWMLLLLVIFWVIVLIPSLMIDEWLKSLWDWYLLIPTVPIIMLVMSSISVVWMSSYVYLLYRKVVADDAKQA